MSSGVYVMYYPTDDNKYYVGYSQNLEKREKQHIRRLVAYTHSNHILQDTFKKYLRLPEFFILEKCLVQDVVAREIYWIKEFNSYYEGMNLTKGGAGGGLGDAHYNAKYTETKYLELLKNLALRPTETISSICNDLDFDVAVAYHIAAGTSHAYLENMEPDLYTLMMGRDNVANMRRANCKYTHSVYEKVFLDLVNTNMKHREIQEKYNVTSGCIEGISSGDTHKYLQEDYPEEYNILVRKKATRRNKSSRLAKYPEVIDPLGTVYIVGEEGAKAFAELHGLHQGHFSELLIGKAKSHKGWKTI